MRTVLMLGGGVQQVRAVECARRAGLRILVADRDPNAPALPMADGGACVDGRDVEGLVAYALEARRRHGLAAVFTTTELVVPAAAVSDALGLPGPGMAAAVRCQRKELARAGFEAAGVPIPRGAVVRSMDEARHAWRALGPAVFVKPTVGAGGAGAGPAADLACLERRLRDALSHSPAVLVEELVRGTHHDVNGFLDARGRLHPLGVADRRFRPGAPEEYEVCAPSALAPRQRGALYRLLGRAARALGVRLGPVKGDFVWSAGGPALLEIAPRLHGPKSSLHALPLAGFEPWRAALAAWCGLAPAPTVPPAHLPRAAVGRAVDVDSLAPARRRALAELPGIASVLEVRVPARDGGAPRPVVWIFATAATAEGARARIDAAVGAAAPQPAAEALASPAAAASCPAVACGSSMHESRRVRISSTS